MTRSPRLAHKWPVVQANTGMDSNPGGGEDSANERGGDARRKF